ncbi:member of the major facilitator superfamily [Mycena olivaceomarginata]|nr:member of the major facilitator superfamily [Mycena olivaceomarginata]
MPDETSPLLGEQNSVSDRHAEDSHKPQISLPSILIPMAFGIFLCAMDQTIVVSSYAAIGSELNQLQNTSWIATAYMMTLTSFHDIFGRKPCLLFPIRFARTLPELILARGLTGIGGGGMSTVASIIMSDIGIMNIIYTSGSAMGAPLGGFLSDSIGWRWGFLIQVPAIVLAFISVFFALHLPHTDTSHFAAKLKRVDFPGALSLVLCVFFLLLGLDRGGNIAWRDSYTISALSLFSLFLALFAAVELRWAAEPFAPRRIIAHRALIGAYLVNFFALMSAFSMLFHVPLFYQAVLGKSPAEVGFWLLPTVLGGVLGSLGGGLCIQVTGKYYWVTVYAYVAMLLGMATTVLEAGVIAKSAVGVALGSLISAVGNGSGVTTSLIALISNAGPADQAIATAVSYLFRSLGSVVGLSVGSTLLQISLRTALRKLLPNDVDIDEIVRRVRESLTYIDEELDAVTAGIVRNAYADAVRVTMWFSTSVAALALASAVFIKEKPITPRAP